MNVRCLSCGEAWDTHHLQHDEVHEVLGDAGIPYDVPYEGWRAVAGTADWQGSQWLDCTDHWKACRDLDQVAPHLKGTWRQAFAQRGWQFGSSVIDVHRCPGCGDAPAPDPEKAEARDLLAAMLVGDEDGLACELEEEP